MKKWIAKLEAFFRSFLIQGLWNYKGLQNVGFAFSLDPLLRASAPNPEARRKALRRHLGFFNTHPYLAPIVIGVAARREAERGEAMATADGTLDILKNSMGGAFGALGDHVIWASWRPFCAALAMSLGVLVAYPTRDWGEAARWWVWGFLGLFNALHLALRWIGLHRGLEDGPAVVRWLERIRLQTLAAQVRRVGLLALAGLTLFYLSRWTSAAALLAMVSVVFASLVLRRWSVSVVWIFYGTVLTGLTMGFLGWGAI